MKIILIILGLICVGMGVLGAILPILPTTPFLLLAAVCFGKSSSRLDQWFKSTSLYQKHINLYVEKKSMTLKAKLLILSLLTVLFTIGFLIMWKYILVRMIIIVVWLCHVCYFTFRIKNQRRID